MSIPTVASLVEAAIVRLLELSPAVVHATAVKQNASCYPTDDINAAFTVKHTFRTPAALRAALVAREPVARRSAIFLLAAVDPASAWPIIEPFVAATPPAKSKDLHVVSHLAPWLAGNIPQIPIPELVALCDNPRVNTQALAGSVVSHRKTSAERLAVLEQVLASTLSNGTWILANALAVALGETARTKVIALLRGTTHASWKVWIRDQRIALRDEDALRDSANSLDSNDPQKAINATVALGPTHWHKLEKRFFDPKTLGTKKGRDLAASIFHTVMTEVSLNGDQRWKKTPTFVTFVDSLAHAKGDLLAFSAASLAAVLRGKKPLERKVVEKTAR